MAKIYGLFGSLTGKLADTVMSVRNGEQIARKYQPIVFNPSTPAQVAQRAKMKLMSQLSAVMAPVIAMPRVGTVSPRNQFTKVNFGTVTYQNNEADITLTEVKLTKSIVSTPAISATRDTNAIRVYLAQGTYFNVDRVVYCMFIKQADNTLRYGGSVTATEAGEGNQWLAELPLTNENVVIYAYGVRVNSDAARTAFGDMTTDPAETVAKLVTSRAISDADITLTETRGYELVANREIEKTTSKK